MGDIVEFVTQSGHQQIFYNITSNAINFEIKGPGNACIALKRNDGPETEFIVGLGSDRRSWIKSVIGRDVHEIAETPNILSAQEYRKFWITWNGNGIRVGGEGHTNPIVSCNCEANSVKYVSFFMTAGIYQTSLHWRVELPPVIKKTITKPISSGALNWVPITADTLVLPDGALIGGYEKENVYIIRAKHRGSLTPGKFVPSEGSAYISWGGDSHNKSVYEVLCGFDCQWVQSHGALMHIGAVVGGYSEDIEHEQLYVGRARYLNHLIPGKVQPSHQVCYIPYDGKEIGIANYEILVVPEKKKYPSTIISRKHETTMIMDEDNEENQDFVDEDDIEYNDFFAQEL